MARGPFGASCPLFLRNGQILGLSPIHKQQQHICFAQCTLRICRCNFFPRYWATDWVCHDFAGIWAAAQQNNKMTCAESSLSVWRKLGSLASYWAHSEDWSAWVDDQADLSLRWAHAILLVLLCCGSYDDQCTDNNHLGATICFLSGRRWDFSKQISQEPKFFRNKK